MTGSRCLLLCLQCLGAAVATPCWQGATFSEAVVSPRRGSGRVHRVPGVASLPGCVAACCERPRCHAAWLLARRCYVLSCLQGTCRTARRPGADSQLVLLQRGPLDALLGGDLELWSPHEAPGDLGEALGLSDPGDPVGPGGGGAGAVSVMTTVGYGGPEAELELELSPYWPEAGTGDTFNRSGSEDTPAAPPTSGSQPDDGWGQSSVAMTKQTPTMAASPQGPPTSIAPPTTAECRADRTIVRMIDSCRWQQISGPPVQLNDSLDLSHLPPGEYAFRLTVPGTSNCNTTSVTSNPPVTAPVVLDGPATPSPGGSSRPNRGPVAVVGPYRIVVLPVGQLLLNGSGSHDDQGVTWYQWSQTSGPLGLQLEGADKAVATATGLRVGLYTFRLIVGDQQGATDNAVFTIRVEEGRTPALVAHASGSHTLTLPNNSLILRGSVTDGNQTKVTYLWVRDPQSPAAGDVLFGSETQPSLILANLVQGTYLFQLRVTDALGRTSTAMATVEVRLGAGAGQQVELEVLVGVQQVSVSQRDTVLRQLAALLHVMDSDLRLAVLPGHTPITTILRVGLQGSPRPPGPGLLQLLRRHLLGDQRDYLLFRVLRADALVCLLSCSERGQCDPFTKECVCDPFWTQNLIRRFLGDGESNCEWRVFYVVISTLLCLIFLLSIGWMLTCCCRSRRRRWRSRSRYSVLDNMDEQENVELWPKYSIKHRSIDHLSSLMMSDSEQESDQDVPRWSHGAQRPHPHPPLLWAEPRPSRPDGGQVTIRGAVG